MVCWPCATLTNRGRAHLPDRNPENRTPHHSMDADQSIQQFVEFVVGELIEHPEQASITRHRDDRNTLFFDVTLADQDVGRIIGKNGHVISSMRSLLDAAGEKHGMRVRLKLHSRDQAGAKQSVDEED